jgi:hypothetical protein
MNVPPNQSNSASSSQDETPQAIGATEDTQTDRLVEELIRRIGPRIMERITEMINEALSCKCCT